MKKIELEFRLKIAEKAINDALKAMSRESIEKTAENEKYKEHSRNLAIAYAEACGCAKAKLENYFIKSKEIEEHGLEFVEKYFSEY